MWSSLLKLASTDNVWSALAVALILYILKTQEKRDQVQAEREKKYQQVISKLTDELKVIKDIEKNILEIKESINGKKR